MRGCTTWERDVLAHIAGKKSPADGLLQRHVNDGMKSMDPGRRKTLLHLTRIERIEIPRSELAQREMSKGRQNVFVKGTAIRKIGAVPNFCLVDCEPAFEVLCDGLIFLCDQRSLSLLIEHCVKRLTRLFLCAEVALLGFAMLEEDLCDPLFPLPILALKDRAV